VSKPTVKTRDALRNKLLDSYRAVREAAKERQVAAGAHAVKKADAAIRKPFRYK